MSSDLAELANQYGSIAFVPQDLLYAGLINSKEDLIKIPPAELRQSALGQHVTRLCKTDLFWMCRYFTWETNSAGVDKSIEENLITEAEYRKVCDLFVKKDCTKTVAQQDFFKNRLLLWPRGGFKSTIDVVDAGQWILNFPDIRILFLTGANDLATGFVKETKGHFIIRDGEPTLMNLFFPEFCVLESARESEFEFTCPVWAAKQINRKEPTVLASSVGATKSGWHFEVIKGDDPVTDENTDSTERCASISKKLNLSKNLLRKGGYYNDYIGTRYADEDHYGVQLEKNIGDIKTVRGPCWELIENITTATKILIGRGIVIKPEVAVKLAQDGRPITYIEAGEEGCDLLIPRVMPYPALMRDYRENEEVFEGQINQNPRPASSTTFERKDLLAATVRFDQMPFRGPISQTWDFAFSRKKGRDFSTGASVIWNDKAQMFVHDLIRAHFKPNDLAQAVVDFARKWHPFIIGIEDASGSRFSEPTIIEKAKQTGDEQVIAVCSKIDWFKPDTQYDAKRIRMGTLHPALMEGRLKFANYISEVVSGVLYDEFERCMTSRSARNDIPDVVSQQLRYSPQILTMVDKNEMAGWTPGNAGWNLIFEDGDAFGRPGFGTPPPIVEMLPEPEIENVPYAPGLDNILGAGLLG